MKQYLFKNKRLFLIIIPLVLLTLTFILNGLSGKKSANKQNTTIIPTPKTYALPTQNSRQQSPTIVHTNPPVSYDLSAEEKMQKRLTNRVPLNNSDYLAKQQLLNTIQNKSAILYVTPNFHVEYMSSADVFMVKISTINIRKAKSEAETWFISKGFSGKALCEMPVIFYLNSGTAEQLRPLSMTFSPLAEGC